MGKVVKILYRPNRGPPDIPDVVYCQFDTYLGPSVFGDKMEKVVPIVPYVHVWFKDKIQCTRQQLPLVPAYAKTIHKSQGIQLSNMIYYVFHYQSNFPTGDTCDAVILNLGDRETSPGLSYTGMSRVKNLEGLSFQPLPSYERLTKFTGYKYFIERVEEDERLKQSEDKTLTWIKETIESYDLSIESDSDSEETDNTVQPMQISDEEYFSMEEESAE